MLGQTARKLIIVVDDKTAKYGELLSALVSMKDDKDDLMVGVPDGSVEAAVWTEKVYKDNQAQLGSSTKIVFIGQSESAKAVIANISGENEFSKYGVCFGNLGNKAAIFTDKDVLIDNQKLYDEFIDSYMMFISNSDSDYIASQVVERQVVPSVIIREKKAIASEKLSKGYELVESSVSNASNLPAKVSEERQKGGLLKKISGKASKLAVAAVDAAVDAGENAAEMTKGIVKSNKEIPNQQYRCGVLAFYIQQLGEFMEG